MVDVGGLDDVINVVEESVDITWVAEKTWDARDAGESAGVGDGFEDFVRLAADVFVQICRATMAGGVKLHGLMMNLWFGVRQSTPWRFYRLWGR